MYQRKIVTTVVKKSEDEPARNSVMKKIWDYIILLPKLIQYLIKKGPLF
jgi:hypothetical protein